MVKDSFSNGDIEILVDNIRAMTRKPSPEFKEQIARTIEDLWSQLSRERRAAAERE